MMHKESFKLWGWRVLKFGYTQNDLSPYVLKLVLGNKQLDEAEQVMCGCDGDEQFLQISRTFTIAGLVTQQQNLELDSKSIGRQYKSAKGGAT